MYTTKMAENMPSHGVNVIDLPWKKQKFLPTQISQYLTFPYRRIAKLGEDDLLHLPGPFNPSCLSSRSKVITTFHDHVYYDHYPNPTKSQRLIKVIERLTAAKTDYVITPSQFTADRTLARFPKFKGKIEVAYPGVSDTFFERRTQDECDRALQAISLKPTDRFLLYVGALIPYKNHARVVAAYAKLKDTYPDLKLVMIGSIRRRPSFPKLVQWLKEKDFSLQTDVIIPEKKLSTQELSAIYQKASVFLFPSLYEGWGIVVGEAFASGTPSVISNIPVFQECFSGGALMVDPHSVDEMVEGVKAMLNSDQLKEQYTKRAAEIIQNQTWETSVKATVKAYHQIEAMA